MKRNFAMFMLIGISMFLGMQITTFAKTDEVKLYLNGRRRWDSEVIMKNNVTYVPLRMVGEELGAQVQYNGNDKSIMIVKADKTFKVQVGKKEATLNGQKERLDSPIMMFTNEDGKNLAYVPLRNIFEVFDGVVNYNKEYQYINVYNMQHISYSALKGLGSEDLTSYRFAQLALPRVGGENMCVEGGRITHYIFPLNKKSNYFFVGTDPSGDMDISTMAYMEVDNGVAVCKWYKEVRGDVEGRINTQDNSINMFLGNRTITEEIGAFPNLEETNFISFTRHSMIQPDPNEDLTLYKDIFNRMIEVLTPEGEKSLTEDTQIEGPIRSPYLSPYQVTYGDGTLSYISYYNDVLLSKLDEGSLLGE